MSYDTLPNLYVPVDRKVYGRILRAAPDSYDEPIFSPRGGLAVMESKSPREHNPRAYAIYTAGARPLYFVRADLIGARIHTVTITAAFEEV